MTMAKRDTLFHAVRRTASAAVLLLFTGCETWELEMNMDPEQAGNDVSLNLAKSQEKPDLTVSQLLKRMREASDPKEVWYNCKSYILRQTAVTQEKGTFSTTERYYTTEIRFRQPAQMRQTSFQDNIPIQTLLYRDNKGWIIDKKGNASEYTGEEMRLFQNYIGFADPKASEQTLFSNVELSVIYENEKRVYRMVCRSADSDIPPYVRYIDAETFLPIRMETILIKGKKRFLYRAEPQEYKWISDVKMPMTTIVTIGDKEMMEYHTIELLLNPDIPESDFLVPDSDPGIDYTKMKE